MEGVRVAIKREDGRKRDGARRKERKIRGKSIMTTMSMPQVCLSHLRYFHRPFHKKVFRFHVLFSFTETMVPPTRPHITKLTDHSVMVRWAVPENNGLKITFFKLQYRDVGEQSVNGASEWKTLTAEIEPHIRSYEVLDLETGHSYRFRIAAAYSNNDSKFGPTSYKFMLQKEPPMKKPVIGPVIKSAEPVSPSAILILWEVILHL